MFHRCFTRPKALLGLLALTLPLLTSAASAHPLGNYSINQYTLFDLRSDEFKLIYLLDFAEIPSFREMDLLDSDMDNAISDSEIDAYFEKRVPQFLSNLELSRDGESLSLRLLSQRLEVYEGIGAMPVFNVFLELTPVDWTWPAPDEGMTLEYRSSNHKSARGYRESKILLDGRYEIDYGPWTEGELKYLVLVDWDDKENPLFQSFYNRFLLDLSPGSAKTLAGLPEVPDFSWTATARAEKDTFALMAKGGRTFAAGEGPISEPKTIVAQAAGPPAPAGTELTAEASAAPATKVTVVRATRRPEASRSETSEHLIGRVSEIIRTQELTLATMLLALGIALLLGMGHAFSPGHGKTVMAAYLIGERGTVWHAFALGVIVTFTHVWSVLLLGIVTLYAGEKFTEAQVTFWTGVASGIIIVIIGVVLFIQRYSAYVLARQAHRHQHGHDHAHSHDHPDHSHDHAHAHDHHDHSHEHAHSHEHDHEHTHDHVHSHDHDHEHVHRHGLFGKSHSHVVETEGGAPPSYSSVIWLGVSGGIVPCPAALIVLLMAIKFGRLQLGLLLILAFSVGLAAVLVAIGIAVVKASGRIRKAIGERSPILLALPVVSSVLITILGLWVVVWTLLQFNVINIAPIG